MKHRIFFFIVLMQIVTNASAKTALINGVCYEFSNFTATVISTKDYYYYSYSGAIIIPSTIQYEGSTYDVKEIGTAAFSECKNVYSVTISEGIKKIGRRAFYKCSLKSISIPNSVTYIDYDAFEGSSLVNATIRCSSIVDGCFAGITTLKNVVLDNSVTIIGESAFRGCTSLSSIIIPESVVSIGDGAFNGCTSLASIIIPESVVSVGSEAFKNCSSLTSINIPKNITSIEEGTFEGCIGLQSIIIPDEVTNIGERAFYDCKGLQYVRIGKGIEVIPGAFGTGHRIASFTVGPSVKEIQSPFWREDRRIFLPIKVIWLPANCPKNYKDALGDINYVPSSGEYGRSTDDKGTYYRYNYLSSMFEVDGIRYVLVDPSNRTCDAIDCTYDSTLTDININNTVSYQGIELKVNKVQPHLFYNNSHVTHVSFNNGQEKIGENFFNGCTALTDVSFSEFTTQIETKAFANCTRLHRLVIPPNIKYINDDAFMGCSSLNEVNIEYKTSDLFIETTATSGVSRILFEDCPLDSVFIDRSIGGGVSPFKSNNTLRSVTIGDNVKGISSSLFSDCSNLEYIHIGSRVTSIGNTAFFGCTKLCDFQTGPAVSSIGDNTFSGCVVLKNFTIGQSVSKIGSYAFKGCVNIEKITCYASNPPTCNSLALNDINKFSCVLSVPNGTLSAYKSAYQWKDFFYVEEIPNDIKAIQTAPECEGKLIYDSIGRRLSTLQRGINILRMSDGTTKKVLIK